MGGEEFALEKANRRLVLPECWFARSRVHPRPLRIRSEINSRLRPEEPCLCDSQRYRLAEGRPGVPAASGEAFIFLARNLAKPKPAPITTPTPSCCRRSARACRWWFSKPGRTADRS